MRRFIVHTLAQARAVLTAAAEADRPVILQSPADAVRWLGAGYFLALVSLARAAVPAARATAILDCGDAPGLALTALRAGAEGVRLAAVDVDVLAKVTDIASQQGAFVEGDVANGALDLHGVANPYRAALALLLPRDGNHGIEN